MTRDPGRRAVVRWAFSFSNAGARYAEFGCSGQDLGRLDWGSIDARDFREPDVKEAKQAEFLVHGRFPVGLVERVGSRSAGVGRRTREALRGLDRPPVVEVREDWYY